MTREIWNDALEKTALKGALAFIVAAVIALLAAMPAWAVEVDKDAILSVTAKITATIKAPQGADTFGENDTLVYTAAPVGILDEERICLQSGFAALNNVQVKLAGKSIAASDTLTAESAAFDFSGVTFSKPGTYVYEISQSSAQSIANMHYTKAKYFMYVNVENASSGLAIKSVYYVQSVDDNGTKTYTEQSASDGAGSTYYVFNNVKKADPVFSNTYSVEAANFKITNAVAGAYASKTDEFEITLVLTVPTDAEWPDGGFPYVIHKVSSLDTQAQETTTSGSYTKTAKLAVFNLKHGDYVTFDSLPVGTTYTIAVEGKENYTTTANVASTKTDGTAQNASVNGTTEGNGMMAAQFTDEAASEATIGPTTGGNIVDIVNTCTATTPTGILIANLPYILLIGIPVVALVAWVVIRRKRYSQAA